MSRLRPVLMLSFGVILAVSAAACREKAPTATNAAPSAAPSPPAQSAAPRARAAAPFVEPAPAPVPEDFEETVDREITGKNLEKELDKLEREMKTP
ncbi:MAG TPA: hypothetical protein VFQ35_17850 [Polyangiaceae bacterium]|nr:hypothetical protein [Polyangiaceae bacterium]